MLNKFSIEEPLQDSKEHSFGNARWHHRQGLTFCPRISDMLHRRTVFTNCHKTHKI